MAWHHRTPRTTTVVSTIVAFIALSAFWHAMMPGEAAAPMIRFEIRPELKNIQQLRGVRLETLTPCQLPAVAVAVAGTPVTSTDGTLKVLLFPGWTRTHIDTSSAMFHTPTVTYKNAGYAEITVMRITNGAEGRSFRADASAQPLPVERNCEVSNDSAGSIWTFYHTEEKYAYSALADAITPQGKRHKFSISAMTASARDSLASILATAVFAQRP